MFLLKIDTTYMYFVYHELYIKRYRHWVLINVLLEILNLNMLDVVYKCSINSKTKYWIRVIFQTRDTRLWQSSGYHSPLLTCYSLVFALKASYGSFNPNLKTPLAAYLCNSIRGRKLKTYGNKRLAGL